MNRNARFRQKLQEPVLTHAMSAHNPFVRETGGRGRIRRDMG